MKEDNFTYKKFDEMISTRLANLNASLSSLESDSMSSSGVGSSGNNGWSRVAVLFELVYQMVKHLGDESEGAARIKELTVNYLNDNLTKWIENGWVSNCYSNLFIFLYVLKILDFYLIVILYYSYFQDCVTPSQNGNDNMTCSI